MDQWFDGSSILLTFYIGNKSQQWKNCRFSLFEKLWVAMPQMQLHNTLHNPPYNCNNCYFRVEKLCFNFDWFAANAPIPSPIMLQENHFVKSVQFTWWSAKTLQVQMNHTIVFVSFSGTSQQSNPWECKEAHWELPTFTFSIHLNFQHYLRDHFNFWVQLN